jgi:CBS domain-containing protein
MPEDLVYVTRLIRLPLTDSEGAPIGQIDDIVIAPPHGRGAPQVIGFVVIVQRRRIFVSANRVGELGVEGVRLKSGTIDLRHFELRPGELLGRNVIDQRVGDKRVNDLSIRSSQRRDRAWEVATVSFGGGHLRRRRKAEVLPWSELPSLFDVGSLGGEMASYREMHPSDVAQVVRRLPEERRRQLAEAMEDDRLADLLEELSEEEQIALIEGLDLERLAHVVEEMDPDDAADLLGEMTRERQTELLAAMEPEEAGPLRRLLLYEKKTAGGLMTPEPLIATPETTVAEALARLRESDVPSALAAQIFVVQPPKQPPTGTFMGTVGVQRLLREAPGVQIGRCLEEEPEFVTPNRAEVEVASRLAAYDLLALAVCDESGRLLGAVTVDDILDHLLPVNWRQRAQ